MIDETTFDTQEVKQNRRKKEISFTGVPASPGIIIGTIFLFSPEEENVTQYKIQEKDIPLEIAKFEKALIKTRKEILDIQKKIAEELGTEHAEIFNAHLLVVEDHSLIEEVIKQIEQTKINVAYIFYQVAKKYAAVFASMKDDYLKERASDVRDVTKRILRNLTGSVRGDFRSLKENVVVVANDLSPSDTALMHKEKVVGFVTDIGGRTSHTAILAKSIGIPAVVGLSTASASVTQGDTIIVDGNTGIVIVNPRHATIQKYSKKQHRFLDFEGELAKIKKLPAETQDGFRVVIQGNIELAQDTTAVKNSGASGIGLYRTEYFYMGREDLPTEEEHYQAYLSVAKAMYPGNVIIRTLDIGGDKFLSHLNIPREMNPFLGCRAIRFCFERVDIFKVQLAAILRASVQKNIKIMFPMISSVSEVYRVKQIIEEVKVELRKKEQAFDEKIEVGVMIEVPSAAMTADLIAKEVDFFSIGTNDLIQYSLAVDRINEKIAYLYKPTHPAVLRFIKNIIDSGHQENIWIGMCGEMASEPALALILVGLGIDELSMNAVSIPLVKKALRSVTILEAQELAAHVLTLADPDEISREANKLLKKVAPELLTV